MSSFKLEKRKWEKKKKERKKEREESMLENISIFLLPYWHTDMLIKG